MTGTASATDAGPALRPTKRAAAGTPERELERLALQELTHPRADPLAIQTFIWICRAYNAATSELSRDLRPLDLSASAFNVLQSLANTPRQELEPCELAERLLVSRPSITGLIDTLEARSLVARRRHPDDRRRVLVGLTGQARELLDEHYADHYRCLDRIAGALSADERETLVTLLRRIHGAMPAELAEDEPAAKDEA